VVATITIPPMLRGQELYLDLVWLYFASDSRHRVLVVPPDARTMTIEDGNATALAAALYTADLRLVDAMTFSARCPDAVAAVPSLIHEVPVEFAAIQDAIDAAEPGTIVYVHPGTYSESLRLRPGVRLIGAGADQTILDGLGLGESLIDFRGAAGAVVRGFTLRNVGTATAEEGCGLDGEYFTCQPYALQKAVFGASDMADENTSACDTSLVLMHNVIEANPVGVVLHRHAQAAIRNNLFLGNYDSVIVSDRADHSLILANTFDGDEYRSVLSAAGLLDVVGNIVTRTVTAFEHDELAEPRAEFNCNVAFGVIDTGWPLIDDGGGTNGYADPGFLDPDGRDYRLSDGPNDRFQECYDTSTTGVPAFDVAPGAYGGPLGNWYGQTITFEELQGMFEGIPLP
jgi:hypothetical protein